MTEATRVLAKPWPFLYSVDPAGGIVRNVESSATAAAPAPEPEGLSLRELLVLRGIKPSTKPKAKARAVATG